MLMLTSAPKFAGVTRCYVSIINIIIIIKLVVSRFKQVLWRMAVYMVYFYIYIDKHPP